MSDYKLTTTGMVVDRAGIDWSTVCSRGHFVKYEIPYSEKDKWDYLHNWYLKNSKYPYYLNTAAHALYVQYPSKQEAVDLVYDDQPWKPQKMDIENPHLFHVLVKLLLSDFFYQRDILVSNGDFYLLVYTTNTSRAAKVLDIKLQQQPGTDVAYELAIVDSATTLVRLTSLRDSNMQGAYYVIDQQGGLPILRRLNPKKMSQQHLEAGVYAKLRQSRYRTMIRYLDMSSIAALKRSRVYHLDRFMTSVISYFTRVGLPFTQRVASYERMNQMPVTKFTKPQIDMRSKTVLLVDDRIRPAIRAELEPQTFADDLAERLIATADAEWLPRLVRQDKTLLQPSNLVLRLQDNVASDFKVNSTVDANGEEIALNAAILRSYDDPYHQYHKTHPDTVTQSLNINTHTETGEELFDEIEGEDVDAQALAFDDEDNETTEIVDDRTPVPASSLEEYLSYNLPPRTGAFRASLLNCFYQLHLKHIVARPQHAVQELHILTLMNDTIFAYANSLVYVDNGSLHFMPLADNSKASEIIQQRTGWDLFEDVLGPALVGKNSRKSDKEKIQQILKQGRFMINPNYIWEIEDSPARVLYPMTEIQRRMRVLEQEQAKEDYLPTYNEAELNIFSREQLEKLQQFIEAEVDDYISFKDLTRKYGKNGLYSLLGVTNSKKVKQYLETKGMSLLSPKVSDVITAYTGISYIAETQEYYVGDKYGMDERYRQDKGFVLRKVVVRRERPNQPPLAEQLRSQLFPLLEVNFVRYNQYTVYPFPFKLIEIWNEVVRRKPVDGEE